MAGQGPPPKDPAKRRRRNADPVATTSLESDGRRRGPALPEDYSWHDRTAAWWESWRRSAQAATFTPTDWDFLLDTAMLHDRMWRGDEKVAAEVRLRVAKFGATLEDRARLRLTVETPAAARKRAAAPKAAPGTVTEIASRRARLSG